MLITGVFIGYMFRLFDRKDIVKSVFKEHPRSLLILVVPVMIYNMCISFDTNLLGKSWGQIFIIALPGWFRFIADQTISNPQKFLCGNTRD